MTKSRKSRLSNKKGQSNSNQPPAKHPQRDFVPAISDVTQEGECFVMVGGVQPPAKTEADFEPEVIDITEEGDFETWV